MRASREFGMRLIQSHAAGGVRHGARLVWSTHRAGVIMVLLGTPKLRWSVRRRKHQVDLGSMRCVAVARLIGHEWPRRDGWIHCPLRARQSAETPWCRVFPPGWPFGGTHGERGVCRSTISPLHVPSLLLTSSRLTFRGSFSGIRLVPRIGLAQMMLRSTGAFTAEPLYA